MDQLIDLNIFPVLKSSEIFKQNFKTLRLLSVFGRNGSEVIFATKDDIIFCFGENRNGFLGLGHWKNQITPELNGVLTHKKVVDIGVGFNHVLALTASGDVYSWGQNDFGQLGVGKCNTGCSSPQIIRHLNGIKVVQISCGNGFSMALTAYGQVFIWGRNSYQQLGLCTTLPSVWLPRRICFEEKMVSISCGRIHSMALTYSGRVYVWGVLNNDETILAANPSSNPLNSPSILQEFKQISVTKVICGPNYSLLLTSDHKLYSFGGNYYGQLGKGTFKQQNTPIRVGETVLFKDIFASSSDFLSIGVSIENEYYIWGGTGSKKVFSPQRLNESFLSVHDIYAKHCYQKILFKTIEIKEQNINEEKTLIKEKEIQSKSNSSKLNISLNIFDDISDEINSSITTQTPEFISENVFQKKLFNSFNNSEDYDLKFIFNDKIIYCHKTILKFRNNNFWQKCKQRFKNCQKSEIHIKPNYYNSFMQFIRHLYGLTPEIDEQNSIQLLKMADIFAETELKDFCSNYLQQTIDLSNVCSIYETSVERKLIDLKNSCIEFVSTNNEQVLTSEAFLTLNPKLSQQLIYEINSV